MFEIEFKDYKDYLKCIYEFWEEGYINELEESGLIIAFPKENNTIKYRKLTEEEFKEKYGK